jgi:hypothetical protein
VSLPSPDIQGPGPADGVEPLGQSAIQLAWILPAQLEKRVLNNVAGSIHVAD